MNSLIPDAMAQTAGGAQQASGLSMLKQLSAGDEVVLAGGILGRIVELGDQFLTIEIADNVRIKVQRFQVTSLVPKGTYKGA